MTLAAVWGASGFAGAALCRELEAAGWSVRRLQRRPATSATVLDFASSESAMREALRAVGIAYHCAGKIGDDELSGYADAAERFARACVTAGVRRVVHLSTVAVYGVALRGEFGRDSPLAGSGAYALSRIEAERRVLAAVSGSATQALVVRVPMIVGPGMPGSALRRFFGVIRWGVFPHPGPAEATLACLGVRRLAVLLLALGHLESVAHGPIVQFADHLPWTKLARRYGEARGRRILRIPLPALGGKLAVFASTARYADDSDAFIPIGINPPSTWDDLDDLIRP